MPPADRAYLSILQWPDGVTEDWCAAALGVAGLDSFAARQAVRRGVPQVVASLDAADAARAVEALHTAGVTAMAPSRTAMRAMATCIRAKRFISGEAAAAGLYAVEPWNTRTDGDGLTFRPADLFLLVRASLRATTSKSGPDFDHPGSVTATTMLGPDVAIASGAMGQDDPTMVSRVTRTKLSEVLDLHLRSGVRVRINADKFNFDILGPGRRYSDRESIDKLAVLLAEQAPKAIVDTSFEKFRCPPEITREHFQAVGAETIRRSTDAPAFEFYSTWACMMYRAMLA